MYKYRRTSKKRVGSNSVGAMALCNPYNNGEFHGQSVVDDDNLEVSTMVFRRRNPKAEKCHSGLQQKLSNGEIFVTSVVGSSRENQADTLCGSVPRCFGKGRDSSSFLLGSPCQSLPRKTLQILHPSHHLQARRHGFCKFFFLPPFFS